jgi:hypothetical protein
MPATPRRSKRRLSGPSHVSRPLRRRSHVKRRIDWNAVTAATGFFSILVVAASLFWTNSFNREQLDLATESQRADRFVKAMDQLGQEGNDKLSIRLGGVYSLDTLMHDSPSDESRVVGVLSAFVRTHNGLPAGVLPGAIPTAAADTQAALTALSYRPHPNDHLPDLSRSLLGLGHIDLHKGDLQGASLRMAFLRGALLQDANLEGANLEGANLRLAHLNGTNLRGANLRGADLSGAELGADLRNADLKGAKLNNANLLNARLNPAQLKCVRINGATKLPSGAVADVPGSPTLCG